MFWTEIKLLTLEEEDGWHIPIYFLRLKAFHRLKVRNSELEQVQYVVAEEAPKNDIVRPLLLVCSTHKESTVLFSTDMLHVANVVEGVQVLA